MPSGSELDLDGAGLHISSCCVWVAHYAFTIETTVMLSHADTARIITRAIIS